MGFYDDDDNVVDVDGMLGKEIPGGENTLNQAVNKTLSDKELGIKDEGGPSAKAKAEPEDEEDTGTEEGEVEGKEEDEDEDGEFEDFEDGEGEEEEDDEGEEDEEPAQNGALDQRVADLESQLGQAIQQNNMLLQTIIQGAAKKEPEVDQAELVERAAQAVNLDLDQDTFDDLMQDHEKFSGFAKKLVALAKQELLNELPQHLDTRISQRDETRSRIERSSTEWVTKNKVTFDKMGPAFSNLFMQTVDAVDKKHGFDPAKVPETLDGILRYLLNQAQSMGVDVSAATDGKKRKGRKKPPSRRPTSGGANRRTRSGKVKKKGTDMEDFIDEVLGSSSVSFSVKPGG